MILWTKRKTIKFVMFVTIIRPLLPFTVGLLNKAHKSMKTKQLKISTRHHGSMLIENTVTCLKKILLLRRKEQAMKLNWKLNNLNFKMSLILSLYNASYFKTTSQETRLDLKIKHFELILRIHRSKTSFRSMYVR